jgi:hypothetical protein
MLVVLWELARKNECVGFCSWTERAFRSTLIRFDAKRKKAVG